MGADLRRQRGAHGEYRASRRCARCPRLDAAFGFAQHAAVAAHGHRRRMFAHSAATLAADAALHPQAEASERAKARCYLDETAGLLACAADEIAAAESAVQA